MSEEIRQIYRRAFLMQLHATNAVVMTRSRGVRVPGFEAVSGQMKDLSHDLTTCITALRAATVQWVAFVSHRVARDRQVATFEAPAVTSSKGARLAAEVLTRIRGAGAKTVNSSLRELVVILDDARRFAATGCVLARSAKLEAVYGGDVADSLSGAAVAFTELADSVDESVRAIARRLNANHGSTP